MNRTSIVLALALSLGAVAPVLAQQAAVTNAIMMQRAGTLDKARVEIDKAITDEKTSAKAKTWYTRGEIYEALVGHPIYGKTAPENALEVAAESYQKAIQFDEKGKEFAEPAKKKLANLFGLAFNDGVKKYNAKDYPAAVKAYQLASKLNPQDTSAVLYSAYAFEAAQNPASAEEQYRKVLGMGHKSQQIYGRILLLEQQQNKPDEQQLATVREAMVAYPNSMQLMLLEIDLMLKLKKEQEAIDKIQAALVKDPKNSNLYAVLGSLYDKTGKADLAVQTYAKAVEADPTNFDAQFNLGVYQFNKGAELINKARKMTQSEYAKTGKKIEADSKAYFGKSIPYFEAALKLKPCDKGSLKSLETAYITVGKNADAERIVKMSDDCAAKK